MNKKNYYLIGLTLILFALLMFSNINGTDLEENKSNVNKNAQNEISNEITDPNEINEVKTPKTSGSWILSNFTIDDDGGTPGAMSWAEAKALPAGWCSGNGISGDPYIIENVTINGQEWWNCIKIQDSTAYFEIRNCTFYNSSFQFLSGAVELENVQNGKIIDCNISNNVFGIMAESSSNLLIANNTLNYDSNAGVSIAGGNNNIIIGNNASNCGKGIEIYGQGDWNTIENNNLIHNSNGFKMRGTSTIDNNIFRRNNVSFNINGITLELDNDYNTFSENIIANNTYGIVIFNDALPYTGSDSNTFSNNLIAYNDYSVDIQDAGHENNLFYHNNFTQNKYNAIDDGTNNDWDNGYIGNYWHNYTGTDPDDDGCGTPAYDIAGSAGKQDTRPFCDNNAYNGNPLHVDDDGYYSWNWEWSSTFEWCSGSGTVSDPYIIEDLTIDASTASTGNGILINNSIDVDFIIRNCTIYDAVPSSVWWDNNGNIKLINSNEGQIYSNDLTSTTGANYWKSGICLYESKNLEIINNTCNGNTYGIFLRNSNENLIFNNSADSNHDLGILLQANCHYNNITQNSASSNKGWDGIALYTNSNNNNIINNTVINNTHGRDGNDMAGIRLWNGCSDNNIINNTITQNFDHGVYLKDNCHNNTIRDNTAEDNGDDAIRLEGNCDDNKIIHNSVSNTSAIHGQDIGILLYSGCDKNTITYNTANGNDEQGIIIHTNCHNNAIHNNTANNNSQQGIYLYNNCDDNTISNNTVHNNFGSNGGIFLNINCNYNNITGNDVSNNAGYGVRLITSSDYNIFIGNSLNNNIFSDTCTGNIYAMNKIDGVCTSLIIDNNGGTTDSFTWAEAILHVPWFSGSGLWSDPYIIENIRIDAGGVGSGINIIDSNVHFVIQYCTISNSGNSADYHDSGILLKNTQNGLIFNNTIRDNNGDGIELYDCYDNIISNNTIINNDHHGIYLRTVCYDNLVTNNTVNNNAYSGLGITGNSDNNNITNNLFLNNPYLAINIMQADCGGNLIYNNRFFGTYADDDGTNYWNNTLIGNDWDNYEGVDNNDDGVGDTWYQVSSGVYDKRPIWWDAPVITIISPSLNDLFGNDTLDYQIEVAKANINDPKFKMWYVLDNGSISKNTTFTELSGTILYYLWNNFSNTFINITFYANDSRGYIGFMNVTIEKDVTMPIISISKLGLYGAASDTAINFTIYISGKELDKTWYRIWNKTYWTYNYTFTGTTGRVNQTELWDLLPDDTYIIQFFLNDSLGRMAKKNGTIIKDTSYPTLAIYSPSNYDIFGISPPDIEFNLGDEENLHRIWYNLNDGSLFGNFTYQDDIAKQLDKIRADYWGYMDNGTVTITFWANDTAGNTISVGVPVTVLKDIEIPVVDDIIYPQFGQECTYPPSFTIEITETNFDYMYYTLNDGTQLLQTTQIKSSSGLYPSTASTTMICTIDSDLWSQLNNGEINITFFIVDKGGNVGLKSWMVVRNVQAAILPLDGGGGGDGDDDADELFPWYGIMPWYIQAIVTGAISATVGVAIKMSYNRFRKQRERRAMLEAPTVILTKKYEIVHHNFLTDYGKIEKHECRVGIAQVGLSYTGGTDFAGEYFTSDESHMMRLRPNLVEKVRANIKGMIEKAHENGINILLFPEMTFDLNIDKMRKDALKYAEEYKMYIITGGYHDIKTRQNVCVVFGPDGIQWSQEKHNPATIKLGETIIQEGIEVAPLPHKLHVASTEYGRIAIAICRDFLDMDLRVALKNCEPPVDLVFNPAWTPVTADFKAIHFDARRSIYAYQFFANVAEFGGTIIQVPEKDRTKRTIPAKEEGLIFKDVDIFNLRSERIKWEQKQTKERGFIQSTR